ncbi:MAG: alpha/beta hydrolase [Ruthenibacterium sp.]
MSVTQATKAKVKNIAAIVTCAALVLILFGAALAQWAHTSGGKVQIEDIRFVTEDGGYLRALLYIPQAFPQQRRLPSSCHGYNNTAEVQDLNCVELSKRGYVVMAIDAYGHGHSKFPDPQINGGLAADMGTYAALQYMKTLPYVDLDRIGMTGHSMGSAAIQDGAFRAFEAQKEDPDIVVPAAILPTANSFNLDADGELLLKDYPVNLGAVYGQFDEWALGMWGTVKGSDLNTTPKAIAGMGFSGCEYDTYYRFGDNTPIDRAQAMGPRRKRAAHCVPAPHDHP